MRQEKWSGQEDLNLRPHGPEPCALTRLSYAPTGWNRARGRAQRSRILGEFRSPVNETPRGFIPQNLNAMPVETISGFSSIRALEPVPANVTRDRVSIGV
jgi:hypothetical protein